MKKVFLFCTKLRMFISEIPVVFLLIISFMYNGEMKTSVGLIPLILLLFGLIAFIFLFLFRFILISKKEIGIYGLFSSKDKCILEEGRTLKIIIKKGHYVYLEVWGRDFTPEFEWINKNDPVKRDVRLFREKYVGAKGSVKRILRHFEIPASDLDSFFNSTSYEKEYREIKTTVESVEGNKQISLKFLSTL